VEGKARELAELARRGGMLDDAGFAMLVKLAGSDADVFESSVRELKLLDDAQLKQLRRLGGEASYLEIGSSEVGTSGVAEVSPAGAVHSTEPTSRIDSIGPYTDPVLIGQGGMGAVFSARDPATGGRRVAVKVRLIHPRERSSSKLSDELRARFLREARITARVACPGVPSVYELGRDGAGREFYAMELIEGEPLDAVLERIREGDKETRERFPIAVRVELFARIARVVATAHARKVLHRDIKPANVLVSKQGHPYVVDWGLAKDEGLQEDVALPALEDPERAHDSQKTVFGTRIGTLSYMPPEQALGDMDAVARQSDVFGLGALFFELLFLEPPYVARSNRDIEEQAMRGEVEVPEPLRNTGTRAREHSEVYRPELDGVRNRTDEFIPMSVLLMLQRCLETDPKQRYANAAVLANSIEAYLREGRASEPEVFSSWFQEARRSTRLMLVGAELLCVFGLINLFMAEAPRGGKVNVLEGMVLQVGIWLVVFVLVAMQRWHFVTVAGFLVRRTKAARPALASLAALALPFAAVAVPLMLLRFRNMEIWENPFSLVAIVTGLSAIGLGITTWRREGVRKWWVYGLGSLTVAAGAMASVALASLALYALDGDHLVRSLSVLLNAALYGLVGWAFVQTTVLAFSLWGRDMEVYCDRTGELA